MTPRRLLAQRDQQWHHAEDDESCSRRRRSIRWSSACKPRRSVRKSWLVALVLLRSLCTHAFYAEEDDDDLGKYADGSPEFQQAEADWESKMGRRLEAAWVGRQLTVEPTEAQWLLDRDQLPVLKVGQARLKEVVMTHKRTPWKVRHVKMNDSHGLDEEQLRNSGPARRLLLYEHAVNLTRAKVMRPRDALRLLLALNIAAVPTDMFNTSGPGPTWFQKEFGYTVFQEAQQYLWPEVHPPCIDPIFKDIHPWHPNGSQAVVYCPEGTSTTTTTFIDADFYKSTTTTTSNGGWLAAWKRFQLEMMYMNDTRTRHREMAGEYWKGTKFVGLRMPPCIGHTIDQEKCADDIGVSAAIYEDDTSKFVIFTGLHTNDEDWVDWVDPPSVYDRLEPHIYWSWNIGARQPLDPEQTKRKGNQMDELNYRCAYADNQGHSPWGRRWDPGGKEPNLTAEEWKVYIKQGLDASPGIAKSPPKMNENNYQKYVRPNGLWYIAKYLVRVIMPANRNIAKEREKAFMLSGYGFGGTIAGLTAMWLQRTEAQIYKVVAFAPYGMTCPAMRRYTKEMDPSRAHMNIQVYHHVFDVWAGIGRLPGRTCLYGSTYFTNRSRIWHYCEKIVGHSGPELLYRGPKLKVEEARSDSTQEEGVIEEYFARVEEAQVAFKACHYYTHSLWYAAMLWTDDRVMRSDGTTDGGCFDQQLVTRGDPMYECTRNTYTTRDCYFKLQGKKALPYDLIASVMMGCAGLVAGLFVLGFLCISSVKTDTWIYGKDSFGEELKAILNQFHDRFPWLAEKLLGKRGHRHANQLKVDRAREARSKAMQHRMKQFERRHERMKNKVGGVFGMGIKQDKIMKKIELDTGMQREQEILELLGGDLEAADPREVLKRQIAVGKAEEDRQIEIMEKQASQKQVKPPSREELELLRDWEKCTLTMMVYQAKNLKNPYGEFGLPDPKAVVEVAGKPMTRIETAAIEDSLDPVWNCSSEMRGADSADNWVVEIRDEDPGAAGNGESEVLGKVTVEAWHFWPHGLPRTEMVLEGSGGGATIELEVTIEDHEPLEPKHPFYRRKNGNRKSQEQRVSFGAVETMPLTPPGERGQTSADDPGSPSAAAAAAAEFDEGRRPKVMQKASSSVGSTRSKRSKERGVTKMKSAK
eukprot:TRINITY_DN2021_c0_g1_i1.p1 TRINITY_DN2021_c0_g1~~TRINITY_DN2021_c0_g1_i1.p1  ORF type:complete len:1145 (-),score=279.99 TRINITY_DN2021_c0_g1_i1:79-3513(-)